MDRGYSQSAYHVFVNTKVAELKKTQGYETASMKVLMTQAMKTWNLLPEEEKASLKEGLLKKEKLVSVYSNKRVPSAYYRFIKTKMEEIQKDSGNELLCTKDLVCKAMAAWCALSTEEKAAY